MKNKNKLLLISFVLGVAYLLYSMVYWSGAVGSSSGSKALGAAIAVRLVAPHLICTVVAVVFNGLGLFQNKATFALVAGILYAVALVLFPTYFFFVLAQTILSFVAYAQMRKVAPGAGAPGGLGAPAAQGEAAPVPAAAVPDASALAPAEGTPAPSEASVATPVVSEEASVVSAAAPSSDENA